MKGRIMSIENGKFYLITKNGEFTSADAVKGFAVGDEVEIKNSMPSYMKPIATVAAAFLIMCGGVWGYHIPVRYVDVCINPEIQLSLNILNRVVNVEAKNDDGEKIVSSQNLKNDSINDAIGEIVNSARSFGYMQNGTDGERDVIVSVYGNGAYELSTKIPLNNVRVVEDSDREKAEAANIPVGKYVLIDELSRVDSEQNKDDAKDLSVREIIDKINAAKSAPKPTPTPLPESTPEPTETPVVTETPVETQQPASVAKATTRSGSSKTTTVASNKKTTITNKKTTITKNSSGSSKNNTAIKASTTSKTATASKSTPKPTSSPVSVQVSAAPSKMQSATPLPSFNDVKRPSANNSSDKNGSDTPKNERTEAFETKDDNNKIQPNREQGTATQPSSVKDNNADSKPAKVDAQMYSTPAESKQNEQKPSSAQASGNGKPQSSENKKTPLVSSDNSNGGNINSRPSSNNENGNVPSFSNNGSAVPQHQSQPSGDNGGSRQ